MNNFLSLLLRSFFLSQDKHGGQIGLVVDCEWAEANSEKTEDKIAAARRLDFQLGWYFPLINVILSKLFSLKILANVAS